MRKLFMFMMVSLDGFFEGPNHELDWHNVDEEFNQFALDQLDEIDTLLFGRVTYQMMASYWPTEEAKRDDPEVAEKMNNLSKVVSSTTLDSVDWSNSTLIKGNVPEEVSRLKELPGKDMAIFGSSDLTVSLMKMGLVDEVRIMMNPVVLGKGKLLFGGMGEAKFELLRTKVFNSGNVLLCYQPIEA